MSAEKIGKFQVLETLGTGAHSTILRIRRAVDGKEYALKVVPIDGEDDKKYLEQARHEYRVGQMLNHANLVRIYSFETESDWLFRIKKARLLIEYVHGKPLDEVRLLNSARLMRVFERVASGLVHMHKQGVIHADLKPNNILLGPNRSVKIIDFGLAWIKGEAKDRVQGTPEYMAPETASHKIINERTDIYNFGATMYRLVTLQHPPQIVPDGGGFPLSEKMFVEQLVPVQEINKGVPQELCDLIHACLQFNAHKRPERMSQIQGTLDRLADQAEASSEISEFDE